MCPKVIEIVEWAILSFLDKFFGDSRHGSLRCDVYPGVRSNFLARFCSLCSIRPFLFLYSS